MKKGTIIDLIKYGKAIRCMVIDDHNLLNLHTTAYILDIDLNKETFNVIIENIYELPINEDSGDNTLQH